ncbi:MAG: hypothetical protein J6V15_04160 [Clostridia bacterium]|nr:hypothetical protein [Clostridia bacterium]
MKMLAMNAVREEGRREGNNMQNYGRYEGNRMETSQYGNRYERMENMGYGRMEEDEMQSRRRRYDDGRFAPSNYSEMEGGGMNRIGFEMNYRYPEMEQEYRADAEYTRRDEMEYRPAGEKQRGYAKGGMMQELDQKTAKRWVESMQSEDGRKGSRWNEMQAESIMHQMGIRENPIEFYAILNAMYSDYSKVAKEFGVDRPDFYAKLAEAWINDKDAVEGKAAIYYECIVKH